MQIVESQSGPANIKNASRSLFETIRSKTKIPNLGNSREEFAVQFLVPALLVTQVLFDELREDGFGN